MAIKIDFGLHAMSLKMRSERAQLIANNIANADTPGFKARDLDFSQIMQKSVSSGLTTTHERHVQAAESGTFPRAMKYRLPTQPSIDGNTVDTAVEKSQYAENMMRFNATVNFINGRVSALTKAFRGE